MNGTVAESPPAGAPPRGKVPGRQWYAKSSWWGYRQVLPIHLTWIASLFAIGFLPPAWTPLFAMAGAIAAYRMSFILHDCSHKTMFSRSWENEAWGWYSGFCVFADFRNYRLSHWKHHTNLWEPDDPQAADYVASITGASPSRGRMFVHLLEPLVLLNVVGILTKLVTDTYAEDTGAAGRTPVKGVPMKWPLLGIAAVQFVVAAITTAGFTRWWGYPLFLAVEIPVGLWMSRVRSYLEHGEIDCHHDHPDAEHAIVRTHHPTFLERRILSAAAFHYHAEHHQWPQIPSGQLARVHDEFGEQISGRPGGSYGETLLQVMRATYMSRPPRSDAFQDAPVIATEPVVCGLCGAAEHEHYADTYDFDYRSCRNTWSFVRCLRCDNLYLNPRPRKEDLPVIYPKNYYAYAYDEKFSWLAKKGKALIDRSTFARVGRFVPGALTRYLDIGCGNGRYLRLLAERGVNKEGLHGVELDAEVVQRLRDDGYQVLNAAFEDADLPDNYFQLVTLFSVLEHVANPRDTLQRIHRLLVDGGIVAFEVPNSRSLNGRLFKHIYWGAYHTPRHWNIFSKETIAQLAPALGFELVHVQRTTGHAFWMRSFHNLLTYGYGWKRLGRLFDPEAFLPGVMVATAVDMVRARFDQETDNMIVILRKTSAAGTRPA